MPVIVPPSFDCVPAIVRTATRSSGALVGVQRPSTARPGGTVQYPIVMPRGPHGTEPAQAAKDAAHPLK